ncbi:MAG: hypothetical protein AB1424_03605 [Thermodesulfobacteriota bacterium]
MIRPLLVVILTIILVGTWGSFAVAKEAYSLSKAYNMDKAEQGFKDPPKSEPSPSAIAADAVIGRPLGLATTIVGAGVFLSTFNFYIHSDSVGTAAWGLVGRPAGWTFARPIGRSDPRYDRPGIFK